MIGAVPNDANPPSAKRNHTLKAPYIRRDAGVICRPPGRWPGGRRHLGRGQPRSPKWSFNMREINKLAAAAVAAVTMVLPTVAFAATTMPSAIPVRGQKSDVVKVTTLKPIIGKWTKSDLSALDSARSIKVYDVKSLYTPADQKTVASAESANSANLKKIHSAISADAGLKAWFAKNNIDVNRVIGMSDNKGAVSLYLY
jgi:hypothetical protein